MSITLTLSGKKSVLHSYYYPPIDLGNDRWELGLVNFQTFNSIPNIDESNNTLHYGKGKSVKIPTGSYQISDISKFFKEKLEEVGVMLIISPNNNTLQTII